MDGRILVTRPQPAAERTSERLAAMGFTAVELPLTQTVALPVRAGAIPAEFDAVAVTSENALLHAGDTLSSIREKPCFAVGARTAARARVCGFTTVIEGPGDAAALADIVIGATKAQATILFLCGRHRLDRLETALSTSGRRPVPVETYDTQDVSYSAETLAEKLGEGAFAAVLLYSVRAAARCAELISNRQLSTDRLICLSPRISKPVTALTGLRIEIAPASTEAAVLALLLPAAKGA